MSDLRPLGRPIQRPRPPESPKKPEPVEKAPIPDAVEGKNTRPGDSGVGRPVQRPRSQEAAERSVAAVRAEKAAMPSAVSNLQPARAHFAGPAVGVFFLGAVALLSLFVFAQVVSIVADLARMPAIFRWPGYAVVVIGAVLVAWAAWRVARVYRRLRPARQIDIAQVAAHGRPADLEAARTALRGTLRAWHRDEAAVGRSLETLGMSAETLERLEVGIEQLLEPRPVSAAVWLDTFQQSVVHELDTLATVRTRLYMKRVALRTAVSPNGLLDTAIVLYQGFRLVGDLCTIYRVRADRVGTFYLLGWIIFNGFIAGELESLGEDLIAGGSESLFESVVGEATAHALGRVMGRVAIATTNAVFIRRLGRRSQRLLRPVI